MLFSICSLKLLFSLPPTYHLTCYSFAHRKQLPNPRYNLLNHQVDRLVHLILNLQDEAFDLIGEATQAKQASQEADDDRNGTGESLFDPVGGTANVTCSDL